MVKFVLLVIVSATVLYNYVAGHGMVLEPVNRASRWRYDTRAKADYDDSQGWCGGFYVSLSFCGRFLTSEFSYKNPKTIHLRFNLIKRKKKFEFCLM